MASEQLAAAEWAELFADSDCVAVVAAAVESSYRLSIGTLMMILETRQGKVPSMMVLGRLQTFLRAGIINTSLIISVYICLQLLLHVNSFEFREKFYLLEGEREKKTFRNRKFHKKLFFFI